MSSVLRATASSLGLVVSALTSPVATGTLLLILLRGPEQLRKPLLDLLQRSAQREETLVRALQGLLAYGVVKTTNAYLNTVAQSSWRLAPDTASWNWPGEIALVTGGSAGIGAEIVKGLSARGVRVVVFDVAPLDAGLAKSSDKIHYFKVDVTDPDQVHAAAAQVQAQIGTVSILINNAGIGAHGLIIDQKPAYVQKVFGVNILSHFYTVAAFLPGMLAANHGHIVTIASTAAFVSVPGIAHYCATKAGTLSFHEALRQEIVNVHQKPGVLATVVHPNWTRTGLIAKHADMIEKNQGPLMTPAFVGSEVVKQVLSCRGGQVILPRHYSFVSTLKGWPNWAQEGLRGVIAGQSKVDAVQ